MSEYPASFMIIILTRKQQQNILKIKSK